MKAHSERTTSLDFSPVSALLATVSSDKRIQFWSTDTWEIQRRLAISADEAISCVRYSPSGELLATAGTHTIRIWNPSVSGCIAEFRADSLSLAWAPDGTRLFSAGSFTVQEWNTSTWRQVGDSWSGHTDTIYAIAVNSTGTHVASASYDNHVRLWQLSDQQNIATFKALDEIYCVTFSTDTKHIISGGYGARLAEWAVPEDAFKETSPDNASGEQGANNVQDSHYKILSINMTLRDAFVTGNLNTAQELLTQQIILDGNNHNAYANRSFVFSRKGDWDNALDDALKSISIQSSLPGYMSKGIALCGKMELTKAIIAFDLTFMFTDEDPKTIHLLLLVKAIALFNANRHNEAMLRIQGLAVACPDADTLACHIVEAYLLIQLGLNSLNEARHSEAADHFTAAINTGVLSYEQAIHSAYELFVVLFGWNLASLWQTANQSRCHAFLRADRLVEAYEAYKHVTDIHDEAMKASCLDWSTNFKKECNALCVASGDAALAANTYDRAIELYSVAIDLDLATCTVFANRCKAKIGKMLWEEALEDAQQVIKLNPSSYLGYHLKHTALHGAQRYDESIEAFQFMLFQLDDAHDPEMQALRRQYISPSESQGVIRKVIDDQMEDTPSRLLDTSTGRLCDRDAQINAFDMSSEYSELLSFTTEDANIRIQRIQNVVVTFFRYVMLSHRWEGKEPILHEIQDKDIYELNPVGGVSKLQSFCKTVRDAGYRWAWIDTCCIDQKNNIEVQRSVNSMFAWYHCSALTIIYLSDVPPSSEPGAMARSAWNTRGWTVQEFLAPKIVLFYQSNWTLYLDDRSPNHKKSAGIMRELADATGIDRRALTAFHPGMRGAREKLQWASMRVTTVPEDIAYSLFGIFGVQLPVIHGEKKQNALGRLLQEIIAQSGDISCLDWVGKSSEFNSCLPASISSYTAPPFVLRPLSEDEMQTSISSLRDPKVAELASQLYTKLDKLTAHRFAYRRLHLRCITFAVTEVTQTSSQEQETYFTYAIKADGLNDLLITTEKQITMPVRQKFLLVRPWDRNLLRLYDFAESSNLADDAQSIMTQDYQTAPGSPLSNSSDISHPEDAPDESESDSRALRLIVHLGQPFRAFLIEQQPWSGEYRRIAADHDIIAHVKDMASIQDVANGVTTLEIL